MQKIISLFQRNYDGDRQVRDEVVPGAEWVIAGEGVATEKIDGTACMVQDGKLYKRYDAKKGKTPPEGFIPAEDAPNEHTGHWPGWLLVGDGPEDKWHREAWADNGGSEGTYELIGPKVQGNPYNESRHLLVPHDNGALIDAPLFVDADAAEAFVVLRDYLAHRKRPIEGIVWHHPDGRMVKIKARDFGIKWPR